MKQIDVHIDFSCPFSYLGGEKFLQTIEQENLPLSIARFRSFQQNPTKNNTETNFLNNMSHRFGTDIPGTIARYNRIVKSGKDLGLDFDVTKVIDVNSLNAHIGLQLATRYAKQGEYFRKIMAGHWENGKDFSDMKFIEKVLQELNLDIEEFKNKIEELKQNVNSDIQLARQRRIQGVPAFYTDRLLPLKSNSSFEEFKHSLDK